jgi:hypothetical protein
MDKHSLIVQAIWLRISCSLPHGITIRYLFVAKEFNAYIVVAVAATTTTTTTKTL